MAVLTFFFRNFFKRRDTYLVIKDDILICNGKAIGEIKFIDSLIIEEYVSADAITGIKKIELIYNLKNVEIMSGVNESDCLEIVELIKKFLALPELNIISNIR